jgi:hypothetical protein
MVSMVGPSITDQTDSIKHASFIHLEDSNTATALHRDGTEEGKLEPLISDESYVFRPLGDYQVEVPKIISSLTPELQKCFAPADTLFKEVLGGYDPHFLLITTAQDKVQVKGLLVFNQDSEDSSRVNLYHISAVESGKFEEILDVSLEFIWKSMHNSTIRIFLHHFK